MYKKILVPLDGSELAECVLPHVETVIKACGTPEVIFVQVVESMTVPYGRGVAQVTSMEALKALEIQNRTEAEKYLKGIAASFAQARTKVRTEVLSGEAAGALTDFANKSGADMVIIATHGRSGVSRWVRGSVADRLLRSLRAPVLMVRAPGCGLGI